MRPTAFPSIRRPTALLRALALGLALAIPTALAMTPATWAHTTGGMQAKAAIATVTPQSAAVYLRVENHTPGDDRLISVSTPAAGEAGMHRSTAGADGVMRMEEIAGGVTVPKGQAHDFAPGGDHIMLMGLTAPLRPGDRFPLTLVFATAGQVTVEVTVVRPGEAAGDAPAMDHSGHGAGN